MKFEEIKMAVEVQRKAYQLLLWLKRCARSNPDVFRSEQMEPFATGAACEDWVCRHRDSFPTQLRPSVEQMRAFACVLSSFFKTSFRVAEVRHWDEIENTLVAGLRGIRSRRQKQRLIRSQTQVANDLKRLSLGLLAEDCGGHVAAESLEKACLSPEFCQQLTRYAYGVELVRRCQYVSQGTAVHRLWLELDEAVRKDLSADTIWNARDYLLQWLQKQTLETKI